METALTERGKWYDAMPPYFAYSAMFRILFGEASVCSAEEPSMWRILSVGSSVRSAGNPPRTFGRRKREIRSKAPQSVKEGL